MIHTNELMLGNWVEHNGTPHRVLKLSPYFAYLNGEVGDTNFASINGIPITEELLEKCGYAKTESGTHNDYYGSERDETFVILEHKYQTFVLIKTGTNGGTIAHIRFLHELQNAYFMLTNKHLEVKL